MNAPGQLIFGIPRLDAQHEQLLQLARQMQSAFDQRRPLNELRRLAAILTLHTRLHFMDEEIFMEGAGYPGLEAHRHCHAEFTEGLLRLQCGLRADGPKAFATIVAYELQWIRRHLEQEDDELGSWLRDSEKLAESAEWNSHRPVSSIPTTAV